ncbi:uncharacterized protein LOC135462794 isoform X2 [Liolophura sinensis]|uniref:uncharacterized protein LOC135462794 isoform X2 n=1 Tax=Liolophura sinensis TaxID=3198878 RepID=UPI003158A4B3
MALRHSDRLRRRASEVIVEANGTSNEKVKTTMVIQGDKSGVRVLRSKDDIELMMECDDEPLTPAQLDANFRAKEAHALAMRRIKAAHEGRLSFVRGTPVIHDKPIMLQSGASTVQLSNAGTGSHVIQSPPRQQAGTSILNKNHVQMMRTNSGALGSGTMAHQVPSKQRPAGSIPVGRVAAQPRKQFNASPGSEVIAGTYGLGVKRSYAYDEFSQDSEAAFKKQKKKSHQMDQQGNWVSLDDYYYGKAEGNAWYSEETGEYRFKCWYCNKMLYNNIKAMMHLQSHIDSEKQHNLDLSDLTQCKHCYKQFDTPFEMQTHVEKVHLSTSNVLMCRICEKDHETNSALSSHMKQNHGSCEMPYICQLCFFRSSMYSDVVDHFKKKHDSSPNLLCLYCLKVYKIKFVLNGWGITQNYYHHLVKHQSKTRSKKCTSCKLAFFTPQEMKTHKKRDHAPNPRASCMSLDSKGSSQEQVMIKLPQRSTQGGVKSLNAPAVMKNLDLSRVQIPSYAESFHCFECKGSMSNMDHFKKYTECSMCRFATSCSSAYANHMMSFHSGRNMLRVFLTVPRERPLETRRYCLCGFSSRFGNKIANHMVFCYKRTCYAQKPDPFKEEEEREMDPRRRPGASILDALGLVKKQTAKRSADLESASTEALLSQFENESFVGVTNMSIAQVLSDHNKEQSGDDLDYDVEEEVPSDDDDADYRPGRFTTSPKLSKSRRSRSGTMLVKLNFGKPKSKKIKSESQDGVASSEVPPAGTSRETNLANDSVSNKEDMEKNASTSKEEVTIEDMGNEDVSNPASSVKDGETGNISERKDGDVHEAEDQNVEMEAESGEAEETLEETVEETGGMKGSKKDGNGEENVGEGERTEENETEEVEERIKTKKDRTEEEEEGVEESEQGGKNVQDGAEGVQAEKDVQKEGVQAKKGVQAEEESVKAQEETTQSQEKTEEVKETIGFEKDAEPEEITEEDAQEDIMETESVPEEVTMASGVSEKSLTGDNDRGKLGSTSDPEVPEESEIPENPEQKPETSDNPSSLGEKPSVVEPRQNNFENRIDKSHVVSSEKRNSEGNHPRRESSEASDNRSSSSDHRHHSRSSHDKSDRRHSGSGSYHRDRSHDGHHGSRRDRDDKYRDRNSGRYESRGYSSRDYSHYGDRGQGNRDYGSHGNRDRYHDNRHYDNRHQERGYRKDSQGHGGWQSHGGSSGGYYGNQRRDYH